MKGVGLIGILFEATLDFMPNSFKAPAIRALVTCSPDAKSTSNSLLMKFLEMD